MCDDAVGSDDRARADRDTAEHAAALPEPDTFSDRDRSGFADVAVQRLAVLASVIVVGDIDAPSDEHGVADRHVQRSRQCASAGDRDVVADAEQDGALRVRRRADAVQPAIPTE